MHVANSTFGMHLETSSVPRIQPTRLVQASGFAQAAGRVGALLTLLFAQVSRAAPVSPAQARTAARNWVAHPGRALQENFSGKAVATSWAHGGQDGRPVFYCIAFEGGGYVVTSADDGVHPVVAFSDSGMLKEDPRDPLWALLVDDLPKRTAFARAQEKELAQAPGALLATEISFLESRKAWAELIAEAPVALGVSTVPDVRVSPLVQSKWSQSTVNGLQVYNYYTPNNYVCGCVATAMAQVMRFHQHPTAAVTPETKNCSVDGVNQNLTMLGGTYAWSSMPLVPNSSITTTEREAIGKLAYDAGVSVCMQYTSFSSGANTGLAGLRFSETFGYANSMGYTSSTGLDAAMLGRSVLANLDGGHPVILGIQGSDGGHAVVGDGYGYSGAALYVHLNLGWSGSYDAWYNLPVVEAGGYTFDSVNSVVFNVYPSGTGELLTGRVTSLSGAPLQGAAVTTTRGGTTYSATTGAMGIYALRVPGGGRPYTVTATYGASSASKSVLVPASESTDYLEPLSYYLGTGSIGNSWGNDFALATPPAAPTGVSATDGASTAHVTVSWTASAGATSYSVWRSWSNVSTSAVSLVGGLAATSYDDASAAPGVPYHYWVKASNADGTSGFSASDEGYREDLAVIVPTIQTAAITNVAGTARYRVGFTAKGGRTYAVERTPALVPPAWAVVATVVASADGIQTVDVAIPSDQPAGFYRVKTPE